MQEYSSHDIEEQALTQNNVYSVAFDLFESILEIDDSEGPELSITGSGVEDNVQLIEQSGDEFLFDGFKI